MSIIKLRNSSFLLLSAVLIRGNYVEPKYVCLNFIPLQRLPRQVSCCTAVEVLPFFSHTTFARSGCSDEVVVHVVCQWINIIPLEIFTGNYSLCLANSLHWADVCSYRLEENHWNKLWNASDSQLLCSCYKMLVWNPLHSTINSGSSCIWCIQFMHLKYTDVKCFTKTLDTVRQDNAIVSIYA